MTAPVSDPVTIELSPAALRPDGSPRSYTVRTLGCQMNVHDSERMSGSLEAAGYVPAEDPAHADVVVINTCAVRENAATKLYGQLGTLNRTKLGREGMQIAVGGCLDTAALGAEDAGDGSRLGQALGHGVGGLRGHG